VVDRMTYYYTKHSGNTVSDAVAVVISKICTSFYSKYSLAPEIVIVDGPAKYSPNAKGAHGG